MARLFLAPASAGPYAFECMNRIGITVGSTLAALLLAAGPGAARQTAPAAQPARLVIGQDQAWVREYFPPSGERDLRVITWTNPPQGLDLTSLQVWTIARPWPAASWRWRAPPPALPGDPIIWHPRDARAASGPARDLLDIELERPMSHRMGHSLTYRLPGLSWQAFYRVVVRGIGPQSIQSVQVDLAAYIAIVNETATAFPDARISLMGGADARTPPPKPFGLLGVNPDTPLSDLWLYRPEPAVSLAHYYPLNTPASIPSRQNAEILFARVTRKPASIVHLCQSSDIPSPTRAGGLPLRRQLLIPNTTASGLGFPLPPGKADLFLGAVRGAPLQAGEVAYTPHPGTLQIDMGPADAVRASRSDGEELPLPGGGWQADYSIFLVNQLQSPVQVLVVELPDTPMEWMLVRSSLPNIGAGRELRFEATLPPSSTRTITYALRLTARNP